MAKGTMGFGQAQTGQNIQYGIPVLEVEELGKSGEEWKVSVSLMVVNLDTKIPLVGIEIFLYVNEHRTDNSPLVTEGDGKIVEDFLLEAGTYIFKANIAGTNVVKKSRKLILKDDSAGAKGLSSFHSKVVEIKKGIYMVTVLAQNQDKKAVSGAIVRFQSEIFPDGQKIFPRTDKNGEVSEIISVKKKISLTIGISGIGETDFYTLYP